MVQYIKSLTVQTHFKNKNLVLTEEGQHANDTIIQSTPVKKITLDLKALTICSYELIKIFVFNVTWNENIMLLTNSRKSSPSECSLKCWQVLIGSYLKGHTEITPVSGNRLIRDKSAPLLVIFISPPLVIRVPDDQSHLWPPSLLDCSLGTNQKHGQKLLALPLQVWSVVRSARTLDTSRDQA